MTLKNLKKKLMTQEENWTDKLDEKDEQQLTAKFSLATKHQQ